jgi:hypothetical protein
LGVFGNVFRVVLGDLLGSLFFLEKRVDTGLMMEALEEALGE